MTHRVEAGSYRARVVSGSEQYGQTSNGNDQIVLTVDLVDIGEKVSVFLVFSPLSAPYAMEKLRACGWTGNDLTNLAGIDSNEITVTVKYEMHQGQEKMKTDIFTGGGVVLKDKLDDKGKRAFAARYANLAKATAPVSSGSPPPAKAAAAAGTETTPVDDLPF